MNTSLPTPHATASEPLLRVALRYQALYLDVRPDDIDLRSAITPATADFVRHLRENGYTLDERLLHALTLAAPETLAAIAATIDDILGTHLNWTPLVRGWKVPTGESRADHLITAVANIFGLEPGQEATRLPCGHLIPDGTFPLERYNGCPFCGTPFAVSGYVFHGQGSTLRELRLMTADDMRRQLCALLASPLPPDATQRESLSTLIAAYGVPDGVAVPMRETAMLAVDALVAASRDAEASRLLTSPTDILRYLWYAHTGHLQLITPRTLVAVARRNNHHHFLPLDRSDAAAATRSADLRLSYSRRECRRVATWLNALTLTPEAAAEAMNPQRGMWVRMIHALRLGEYSRRAAFPHLAAILDTFYRQTYVTWQGRVNAAREAGDDDMLLRLLCQRPGAFARALFATMLHVGAAPALTAFATVADELPPRLLLSLANAAGTYFDVETQRVARPVTGLVVPIDHSRRLRELTDDERQTMAAAVADIFAVSMRRRFAAAATAGHHTIYIAPTLFDIPVAIGDRASTVQDTAATPMGTRFHVEGDALRLFLEWGRGLPAQDLDMDLSCRIIFADAKTEECSYYNLQCTGALHSGDIRSIPDLVGTAEYIELNLTALAEAGARYAIFTCNAYSTGSLSPNLVVGWMNSAFPMTVSEEDGVAYDPSCVQHAVRITESNLSKGLVFGVLDVAAREITWLEMAFNAQYLQRLDTTAVEGLLMRLRSKLSLGHLLTIKAEAQHLTAVTTPDLADEAYSSPQDCLTLLA